MTDNLDLAALKAALKGCEGHTEGPWEYNGTSIIHHYQSGPVVIATPKYCKHANAALIALAPHIPALVAEVERLQGELAYANEQMGSMEVALRLHRDDRKAIKAILDSQEGPTEAATGQGCSEKIECPKCKGTGSVLVRYHWSGIALCIECDKCKGTGKIKKPKKEAPHDT